MYMSRIFAIAHPNIAFIKYWGDVNADLHIPANGSISMNLEELRTRTSVGFDSSLLQDELYLNQEPVHAEALERVSRFLERVRRIAGITFFARVESENNFPMAAGIASSASGFAALSLAASRAAGLTLDEAGLSRLARTGSGSACRSVPGGFVEWQAGREDADSYAHSIAPRGHWNLADCIALVDQDEKPVSSSLGHGLAHTSPLQDARVADTPRRLDRCREAILQRDFDGLAAVMEQDSNLMHAVMITSSPALLYWQPATISIMQAVQNWRKEGLQVGYTVDAGPNVHVLCPAEQEKEVHKRLGELKGVKNVLIAHPGGPTEVEVMGNPKQLGAFNPKKPSNP